MYDTNLVLGGKEFTSRLIVGTGKYSTLPIMREAHEASGAEIVTVAVRRAATRPTRRSAPATWRARRGWARW